MNVECASIVKLLSHKEPRAARHGTVEGMWTDSGEFVLNEKGKDTKTEMKIDILYEQLILHDITFYNVYI